ncbi:hypothetical protein GRI75_06030 [Altererythrobacter soli]|uniref:Uncharacterized protein n=1 Tax=Croceibacterium soli TaxID=1739690 RepID=A0A6I4UQP8_9SPHN|nr:hypothetical protein [Croceibacterium soli]
MEIHDFVAFSWFFGRLSSDYVPVSQDFLEDRFDLLAGIGLHARWAEQLGKDF